MADRRDLLLEVRCEEVPARMLEAGIRHFATRLFEELMGRGLGPSEVESGFTPRRLVLVMRGIPLRQADSEELISGPPVRAAFAPDGAPTPAAEGFAQRCGVAVDALERVRTEKGEYVAVRRRVAGRAAAEVLGEVVPRVLREIPWAKTMRWSEGVGPWVRPLHGLLALYGGDVVPMELFGVAAGAETTGHPILSPAPFRVRSPADYRRKLASRGIEVVFEERCRRLWRAMEERATARGGAVVEDPPLLAKLGAICEIPGVLEGSFDPAFLALPREVLATSLRDHQSAFTVERDGHLLPAFLTVMDRPDDPAGRVRAGNEWVVAARLADARFFYHEDLRVPLAERAAALDRLTFHDKLGSYAAKGERLASLAELVCRQLGWADEAASAAETARLLKADLGTEMVRELTSLQGVMGGIYARLEGHPEPVWQALYDQYTPAAVDDPIPRGRLGQACGLADRVDTLVGMFGLGLVPTGSRDPFALRRAAQGALRILLEGKLSLDLELVAVHAVRLYGERLTAGAEQVLASLRPFLHDRLRHLLGRRGFAYDEIEACLAAGTSDVPDLVSRVDALHRIRERPEFLAIVLAAKRIANIVKDAPDHDLDPGVLGEPAERELHRALVALRSEVEEGIGARQYDRVLAAIASLAEVLDRFFVEVLVMAEDPRVRQNRIALLREIQRTLSRTADLTQIVVDKAEYR
ncbi:MAG TPA: glycine--tRNA ligase subunit beta [Thermoanaerobaculia bacterium]|nr:glycine--tRNA ligase subunit beta [Thermoanaerobaculia bacterium]